MRIQMIIENIQLAIEDKITAFEKGLQAATIFVISTLRINGR